MKNLNELLSIKFDRAAFGYRSDQIDFFVSDVAAYVKKLEEENDDLMGKLELLADRLEEYRKDEDSLREALLSAQKIGSNITNEARAKAEMILNEAKVSAERMTNAAKIQQKREEQTLAKLQQEVTTFKQRMISLYRAHLDQISQIPEEQSYAVEPPAVSPEEKSAETNAKETSKADTAAQKEPKFVNQESPVSAFDMPVESVVSPPVTWENPEQFETGKNPEPPEAAAEPESQTAADLEDKAAIKPEEKEQESKKTQTEPEEFVKPETKPFSVKIFDDDESKDKKPEQEDKENRKDENSDEKVPLFNSEKKSSSKFDNLKFGRNS